MSAQILTKVTPAYPPLARQARIQGVVTLSVQITKSGDVGDLQLISGHPMLAPAAIAAVKQWKYKPYLLNGDPIDVETTVTVNFTLADNPPAAGDATAEPGNNASSATSQIVRVSSGVSTGLLVKKVTPKYPHDARAAGIQGVVVLRADIDKEGNIGSLELVSGHPDLAPSAIEAVKQWKYRPYLMNGAAVPFETQIQVNFTLAF